MYFSHSKAQNYWRSNSLSADFLSEYWANLIPKPEGQLNTKALEVIEAVGYIANELLENATKYGYKLANYKFGLALYLYHDCLRFYLTNLIELPAIPKFHELIQELLTEDPRLLQVRQIQKNAMSQNRKSGLGFLTMFNGYEAKLAWKFEGYPPEATLQIVTTMVEITI